ncbi:MAG TPA: hypothetical protein VFI24_27585 [Pyrinomonadaceae bacterium]|nr:hypothetical protein [Pyrinomonadaceae bacterium]
MIKKFFLSPCGKNFFLALLLVALVSAPSFGQRSKSERFDPDGSFWLHGAPPTEFSDFGGINLNVKRSRRLPQPGLETNNGKRYRFKILNVKRERFTFTTDTVAGVSYSFSGRFLKGGVFASGILDDETPVLEGTLTKFRNGRKLAEAKLKFVYFGGT